jgi:hypothetical protein
MQATESLRKDIAVLVKRYAELQYVEKPFKAGKTVVPPSGKVIGATPIFDDVDLKTYNANVDLIEEEITPKIKAIMLAHTLGNPFNVTKVKEICDSDTTFEKTVIWYKCYYEEDKSISIEENLENYIMTAKKKY